MALDKQDKKYIANFRKRIKEGELFSRALIEPKSMSEHLKQDLCRKLIDFSSKHGFTQADIARCTDSSRAQVNEIFKYRIERFTIDFLVDKINLLLTTLEKSNIKIDKSTLLLNLKISEKKR